MSKLIGFDGYQPSDLAHRHMEQVVRRALQADYIGICNPCGEIPLAIWGGFCLLVDLIPYHALPDEGGLTASAERDTESAAAEAARFLIRTNLMRSLYKGEVDRTNRIGVGLTGIHELAWAGFGLTFRDMLQPDNKDARKFWGFLAHISRTVVGAADRYSEELGVNPPETALTIKPSGTVSKLWALTEGWHLPARLFYLRWVQFRQDDPLVSTYRDLGYPVRGPLKTYESTMIVGFPTRTRLAEIMPAEKIVTAAEATMEEQFEWVRLCEHHWLSGAGDHPERGGQVSYTLKYDPDKVSMDDFTRTMRKHMPTVRAISVMPQEKDGGSAYEYLPEEVISSGRYEELMSNIMSSDVAEDIDEVHVSCENGACPIDLKRTI